MLKLIFISKHHRKKKTSHQKVWTPITKAELKAYISLTVHMGITPAPHNRLYWSKDLKFRNQGIADVMSRDRFDLIKKFLYFNTLNEGKKSNETLRKLKVIYDGVSKACINNFKGSVHLSVDESMIAFSGDHAGTIYLPRKPIKNGFKRYVLASSDSYVINFFPSFMTGKDTVIQIVFDLLSKVKIDEGTHLYMDK